MIKTNTTTNLRKLQHPFKARPLPERTFFLWTRFVRIAQLLKRVEVLSTYGAFMILYHIISYYNILYLFCKKGIYFVEGWLVSWPLSLLLRRSKRGNVIKCHCIVDLVSYYFRELPAGQQEYLSLCPFMSCCRLPFPLFDSFEGALASILQNDSWV